jgi:hypothetical protein
VWVCERERGKRDGSDRSRSHSRSFSVPGAGLEPAQPLWSQDFKSCVSTIPPSGLTRLAGLAVLAGLAGREPVGLTAANVKQIFLIRKTDLFFLCFII